MNQPLVSIIIPVYNTAPYLEQCLESIIHQTYENIEVILVDDGSTDESGAICERYARQDNRIQVVHKSNGGQSSARNVALDMMTGEWVLFVDSDDWIETNTLEVIFSHKEDQADIIEFGFSYCNTEREDPQVFFGEILYSNRTALNLLVGGGLSMGIMCDKLFRASVIGDLRFIEGRYYEDTPFIIEFLWRARHFQYIPKVLYHYRIEREGQTTYNMVASRQKHMYQNLEYLIEKYADVVELKLYLSTFYLNRTLAEYRQAYEKPKEKKAELMSTLTPHWELARSMPFIAPTLKQRIKMRFYQLSPRIYAFLRFELPAALRRVIPR